jgi:hypothetical protein
MGKRSAFARRPQDKYSTPPEAVLPLLKHVKHGDMFVEPCAGNGALVRALENHGLSCQWAFDIEPENHEIERRDALSDWDVIPDMSVEWIITNPPWSRDLLHPMIEHFSRIRPTWLLFDADWMHTRQAEPYLKMCTKIVSVGRLKWIPGSKHSGKDNAAWFLFDRRWPAEEAPAFYGRESADG